MEHGRICIIQLHTAREQIKNPADVDGADVHASRCAGVCVFVYVPFYI